MNRFVITGLFLLLSVLGFPQTDYEFWFVAPAVTHQFIPPSPLNYTNLNRPIALYFTIPTGTATVKIEQPANPSFIPIYKTVTSSIAAEVLLSGVLSQIENTPANTILNHGLRITSNQPVTAFYEVQSPYNAATYTLLGRNALGTEFIVPSQDHQSNYEYTDPPARNVFDIVATEDTTTITIVPKAEIIGHMANDTFQIVLNRGQTWSGRAASGDSTAHLGGTFVFSDKPVAITCTDDAVFIANTLPDAIDMTGDQVLPRQLAGKEYIVHSRDYRTSLIYCYAFEDSTFINFRDTIQDITKLINRGETAQFLFNTLNTTLYQMASIHSTKPILVYYFGGFGFTFPTYSWTPQAFSSIVPPISCGGSKRICFTRTPPGGLQDDWVWTVVTKNGNQGKFSLIPNWMTIDSNAFVIVAGTNEEYVAATMGFGGLPGMYATVTIMNSKGSFQIAAMTNDFVSSTSQYAKYSFFSDFSTLYLGTDKHICPGDSTILDAGYGRDSYLWNTGEITQTIWAKNPGTYWVSTTEEGCSLSDTIVISYYWTNPINLGQDRVLCAGDSILLDAGPGRAWYDWSTGDTTQTIYINQPGTYWVNAQDVHCIVHDTIQITWMDSIDIGPNRNICPGDSVLLDAGLGMTSYLWNTGATTQTIWAKNTGKYKVTVTQGACIFSDSLMVSLNPAPNVYLGPDISVCLGQTHMFDAGFCTGCTYSWDDLTTNQMNIGINQTYSTGQAGIYRVTVTGTNGCLGRDTVQLTVYPPMTVSISITASGNPVCEGTIATFTAHPVNGGTTPVYQWYKGLTPVGSNSDTFSYIPVNGDVITVVMTSSPLPCLTGSPATSNAITMTVNPVLSASVTIAADANPVCAGISVKFTATPTNGGTAPVYQWYKGLTPVGSNSDAYSYVPVNGDVITVVMTSNAGPCLTGSPATSNAVTMTVNPLLPASVTIAADANPVCTGTSVKFTATPVNGGTTPVYQWYNGLTPVGSNSDTYSYAPVNGEVITVVMTSTPAPCLAGSPATSNAIAMTVNPLLPASVTITASANPVCAGINVTFTATPVNGGTTPIYQWKVNGGNTGGNSPNFSYIPQTGDSIRCLMTSNLTCISNNPASSNKIVMTASSVPVVTFTLCFDSITTVNAKPIKLKGGIPLGGTYSGPGVNSITSVFTQSAAGIGTMTITYSYTNVALCSASKTKSIIVQSTPAFTCGSNLTDIRDNKEYPTLQLGSQCWMAADLDFGLQIPETSHQRDNCVPEKYKSAVGSPQSAVYQWDEMMLYNETPGLQGLCPPGWHVPTEAEWNILFANWTNNAFAGAPLKYSGYSGFNALLSGVRHLSVQWDYQDVVTFFWSSTPYGTYKAWAHGINDYDPSVAAYPAYRINAFSVRCIKDN